MATKPSRRRERYPARGLNADYYGDGDFNDDPRYYGSQSPPRSRLHAEPPPRRGKSERRRPRSPEYPDDSYGKPSRRSSRRADPRYQQPPPQVNNGGRRHGGGSLTPPYAPEPPRADASGRDRDRDREYRSRRPERHSMPPPSMDPYDRQYAAAAGPRGGRPPKEYRGEPDPYVARRSRRHSPQPEPRPRGRGKDGSPPPRRDDRYGALPRRPRSQARGAFDETSPPRGRPPPAKAGRPRADGAAGGGSANRRSSMPASTKPRGNPWWQHPKVQAGARQAFTAGAQAAMRSKDDTGPWMGHKGAKVATAALSAALVDGLLGHKKSSSTGRDVLHEGGNIAMDEIDKMRRRR